MDMVNENENQEQNMDLDSLDEAEHYKTVVQMNPADI